MVVNESVNNQDGKMVMTCIQEVPSSIFPIHPLTYLILNNFCSWQCH